LDDCETDQHDAEQRRKNQQEAFQKVGGHRQVALRVILGAGAPGVIVGVGAGAPSIGIGEARRSVSG
jgi:hypothetical protein